MPAIAPSRFIVLENIPIIIAGKKLAAAKPNANATTDATNPGGLIPKYAEITIATMAANLAASNSCLSVISGLRVRLSKSCETEVEITSSKPAVVDSAAAIPPAATSAITHAGKLAISGLANTIMSRSTFTSLALFGSVILPAV